MAKGRLLLILLLIFPIFTSSQNIQPLSVSYNESFNSINVTAINVSGDVIEEEYFYSTVDRNYTTVYLTDLDSTYDEVVNYSAAVNLSSGSWRWIYADVLGYLGRGNLTIENLPISIPVLGDDYHISSSAQIYDFVTGLGYIISADVPTYETDAAALAKIGTLTSGKYCKSDGTQIICTYTVPAAYDDTALWSNASGQEIRMQTITDAWIANASGQENRLVQLQENMTLAVTNISNLWSNASSQEVRMQGLVNVDTALGGNISLAVTNISNLWTNASIQEGKIANSIINDTNNNIIIQNLWSNASDQQTHITNLWLNASNQQAQLWQKNVTALWIRFP
jgi:hypothetical protein